MGLIEEIVEWVTEQMRLAVIWLFEAVMEFLKHAPEPDFSSPQAWITGLYNQSLKIGAWLVVPFVIASTIQRLFKGGINEVLKLYLVGLPIAIIGAIFGLSLITLLQVITDDMCSLLYGQMTDDFNAHIEMMRNADFNEQMNSLLVQFLFFGAMLLGVLILFLELIVRNVAIYMSVLFLPMALAAYVWEPTREWLQRLMEAISTLIICKFVIVVVLSFSFAVMRHLAESGQSGDAWQNLGLLVLSITALFISTVAAPLLLSFVLGDAIDADTSSFKNVRDTSVIGSNQSFARQDWKDAFKHVLKTKG